MATAESVGMLKNLQSLNLRAYEVLDDMQGEVESMEATAAVEDQLEKNSKYLSSPPKSNKKPKLDQAKLEKNIEEASQHVIVSSTITEYRKYVRIFSVDWCNF